MPEIGARARAAWMVTILAFSIMWVRLFGLQIIQNAYYDDIAKDNRIQMAVDVARRGLIRDRHGRIVAQNDPSYSVYLLRSKAKPLDRVVPQLAGILERDVDAIRTRLRNATVPSYEPVRVARHVEVEAVCRIEERNELVPGTLLRYETSRHYPSPAGGGHLLGYVTEASGDESDRVSPGSFVGLRGMEQEYDDDLRGQDGAIYLDVTAGGQVVGRSRDFHGRVPTPGVDLELTVDWTLQEFAADALAKRGTGSVVCLQPKTGEVLALVNVPSFDPNIFSGILTQKKWEEVSSDTTHPFLDRALRGLYPPGSTTKLITAAAGLERGLITPSTTFSPCPGGMQFGNRYFRCWKPSGHGTLSLIGALEQSCDVYFYQLSQLLGVDHWADAARECGFGEPTGIDLPDEEGGLVPDSRYYDKRYGKRGWTWTLVLNLGIGQGEFLTTPMQIAQFFATIANDGRIIQPRVVRSYRMLNGNSVPTPVVTHGSLPYSRTTITLLQQALRAVVAGEHGSGRVVSFPDLTVAGKTGTAQNPHGDNHSWFACYAPIDDPQIVVIALVENAGHGSEVAAPLCGEVLRFYFDLPPLAVPVATPQVAEQTEGDIRIDTLFRGRLVP